MNFRLALLTPLVLAAAACGRQDAAPLVAPDPVDYQKRQTGAVKVTVLRDTALSNLLPRYAVAGATAANGQTTVDLVKADDPTFLAGRGLTDASGNILFTGIAPGDYIVRPVLRDSSSFLPTGGIPITVVVGDTITPDTLRVRPGARIAGIIRTDFVNQTRVTNLRHAGVKVYLLRETAVASGVYAIVDSTTTNGVGAYQFFVPPDGRRAQIQYNSTLITDLKDSTTLNGIPPVPYFEKVETLPTLTGISPNRDLTADAAYLYPTRITGIVFRDRNGNGVRDSLPVSNPKEGLVAGDTVVIQLRDSTDSRVITTTRVIAATTTPNTAVNTYTFSPNAAPGKYVLRLDRLASRFPSNPLEFPNGPAYEVLLTYPNPGNSTSTAQCRPYVKPPEINTGTFTNCNFALKSGQ